MSSKTPYEVLGIPTDATEEQIKNAYRSLARQYHPDNFGDNPVAAQMATEKMQELNEAYDNAMAALRGHSNQQAGGAFASVREAIRQNRLADADSELERTPSSMRNAEWHFLKGTVFHRRGWVEQAAAHFDFAANAEPGNAEYQNARNQMNWQRNGNYGQPGQGGPFGGPSSNSCSGCDLCTGLCCADACCQCFGGGGGCC